MEAHSPQSAPHDAPTVPRRARIARLRRLVRPRTWKSILLGVTDPANDAHWSFIERRNTSSYFTAPEPWIADGAVDYLSAQITNDSRVFEWGAGASTLWFVAHGATVTAYETEQEWIDLLGPHTKGRADIKLHMPTDTQYVTPPLTGYHLILIDGHQRSDCAVHVASAGESGQVVVFDDSDRPAHVRGAQALSQRAGSQQWHFPAITPMMTPNLTSIYRLS